MIALKTVIKIIKGNTFTRNSLITKTITRQDGTMIGSFYLPYLIKCQAGNVTQSYCLPRWMARQDGNVTWSYYLPRCGTLRRERNEKLLPSPFDVLLDVYHDVNVEFGSSSLDGSLFSLRRKIYEISNLLDFVLFFLTRIGSS